MSILKNDPIYEFKDGDYSKPRHIILAGSYEEIGFDLATIAKNDYDCELGIYDDPIYGKARKTYMEMHWPEMAERERCPKGIWSIYEDDVVYDSNTLAYDWYDAAKSGTSADLTTCSAAMLPVEVMVASMSPGTMT